MVVSMTASIRDSVTMVIYLPHYGVNARKGEGSFLSNITEDFELNILQSLTDIHQAGLVLKASKLAKAGRLQLMGISLGGVLTLMSAGIDQLFDRYLTFVGGGDIARVLSYPTESDPGSEISIALKGIHIPQERGREFMSRFDPITWAYMVHGKKIVMLNAEKDELLDREMSVNKLVNAYKESGNEVESVFFKGSHRPTFNIPQIWEMASKLILPIRRFLVDPNTIEELKNLEQH